jgi:hypothetical protein
MFDMEVIVRLQDSNLCASITCMIRHYVARRAKVIFDHPHNPDESEFRFAAIRLLALVRARQRLAQTCGWRDLC